MSYDYVLSLHRNLKFNHFKSHTYYISLKMSLQIQMHSNKATMNAWLTILQVLTLNNKPRS